MAEAAPCLTRSVSQPLFASRVFKEGDPLRALTTSVSFGRFMTESLDWEKWSSFSHNRIREDVQKYSRPGAVAEKKAFFEAYFNKFSSKKSAKPPTNENKPPSNYPKKHVSPVTKSNTQKTLSPTVATNENMCNNRGAESEIILKFDSRIRNVDDNISSTCMVEQEKPSSGNVSSPIVSSNIGVEQESSNQDVFAPFTNLVFPETGNVDDIISSTSQAEHEQPITNLVCSQFDSGNVEEKVSSNRVAEGEIASSPNINLVFSRIRNVDDNISSTCMVEQEKISTGNVSSPIVSSNIGVEQPITNLVCSQFDSGNVEEKVSSNGIAEREIALNKDVFPENGSVDDIISSGGQTEHERTSTENVSSENHSFQVKMSNQSSHVDKNRKRQIKDKISGKTKTEISLVKSASRKAPIPEIRPKNQIYKYNPMVSSVNGLKKTTPALPRSENKRSKPLLDRSVNDNKTVVLKSHLTNHSKALNASTKKPRSVTVPSSFSFKSDERAAKRKQFFQNLEQKPKLKEKTRSDDKKLRWSTAIEAKPSTSETKGPTNKIQKVQPTRTCLQKLGMKPKNFIEINKKLLSSSMACLPSKAMMSKK